MKIQKKCGRVSGCGDQGRCEWRSDVFVKIKKENGGRVWGGGVRIDVNGEVKFL